MKEENKIPPITFSTISSETKAVTYREKATNTGCPLDASKNILQLV